MCNNNNSSILDTLFSGMIIGGFIFFVAITLPILPYVEFIARGIYYIFTPNSPFGKIFFVLFILFIGFILYDRSKKILSQRFKNKEALYMFLYGQSFLLMSILSFFTLSFVAEAFISFISWGISEPKETALVLVAMTGCLLLYFSYKQEFNTKVVMAKQNMPKFEPKSVTYQTLICEAEEYLQGKIVERNLATAERLLYKAKELGGDDAKNEVQLIVKRYGLVADVLK